MLDEKKLRYELAYWADFFADRDDDSGFFLKINELFGIERKELELSFLRVRHTGVLAVAKRLRKKYKLFLLSNQLAFKTDYLKKNFDFSAFDGLFFSNELGVIKPKKEIFELILKKIGKKAGECIFVDDYLPNIKTAKKMGFNTIHFKDAEKLKSELKKLGIKF